MYKLIHALTILNSLADNVADLKGGIKFVRSVIEKDGKSESRVNNPDEIDIDMDDDDDDDENENESENENDVEVEEGMISD